MLSIGHPGPCLLGACLCHLLNDALKVYDAFRQAASYPVNTALVRFCLSESGCATCSTSFNCFIPCACRWSLPGVWAFAAYITATNYLQAQKIVRPQVVTSAIVLALHVPLNLLLIYTLGKLPRPTVRLPVVKATSPVPCKKQVCAALTASRNVYNE